MSKAARTALLVVTTVMGLGAGTMALSETAHAAAAPAVSPHAEQARKEGKVVLYFTSPTAEGVGLLNAFRKKYPFIEVDHYRAAAAQMLERFQAEHGANLHVADVFYFARALVPVFREKGFVAQYKSPSAAGLEADPNGYWTAARYYGLLPMVNPKLVPRQSWPQDWSDFANPRKEWMGKVAIVDPYGTTSGHQTQFALYTLLGEQNYRNLLKGIASTKPAVYSTNTPAAEALVAGEYPLLFNNLYDRYIELGVRKGAPIEMVYAKSGMIVYTTVVSLNAKAPHPAAARLLYDFVLSDEAQQMIADAGNYPARTSITPKNLKPLNEVQRVKFDEENAESLENKRLISRIWDEIIGKKGAK